MGKIDIDRINNIIDILEGKSLNRIEEIKVLVCLIEHGIEGDCLRDISSSFSLYDGDSVTRLAKCLKNIYGENYD